MDTHTLFQTLGAIKSVSIEAFVESIKRVSDVGRKQERACIPSKYSKKVVAEVGVNPTLACVTSHAFNNWN